MSTMKVFLNLEMSEVIVKEPGGKYYYKDLEVDLDDDGFCYDSHYYFSFASFLKDLDVLNTKLRDKVLCVSIVESSFYLPALRQYGLYRLGGGELTLTLATHSRHDRCYQFSATSPSFEEMKELVLGVLDGTLWPERDFEAPQVNSQQELIKNLKSKHRERSECTVQARLLRCQQLFAKESLLTKAEDALGKGDEVLCNSILIELGF